MFSLIFKSLICYLTESRKQFPLSLGKSRVCFVFELHLHVVIACFVTSCQSVDKVLPCSRFTLDEWQQEFLLVVQSFSCSLCDQLNRLMSKNCRYTLRICDGIQYLPRIHWGLMWYRLETVSIWHGVAPSSLWERHQCKTVRRNMRTRGKLQRDVGHVRTRVVIVISHINFWNKPCTARTMALGETFGSQPVCLV